MRTLAPLRVLCVSSFALLLTLSCKEEKPAPMPPPEAAKPAEPPKPAATKVGVVTDVGGRGDQSFNDSALRGLELWAAGKRFSGNTYAPATAQELQASIPPELAALQLDIKPLGVTPLVLQSKSQEDYEPNLQLLVDQGAALAVGTGYLLENAVENVARANPKT